MPLTPEHDYSSPAGQKHANHRCICSIPGLRAQMKVVTSDVDATSLVHSMLRSTDNYDLIDRIINNHGQRFLPGLLDYLSWEDVNV